MEIGAAEFAVGDPFEADLLLAADHLADAASSTARSASAAISLAKNFSRASRRAQGAGNCRRDRRGTAATWLLPGAVRRGLAPRGRRAKLIWQFRSAARADLGGRTPGFDERPNDNFTCVCTAGSTSNCHPHASGDSRGETVVCPWSGFVEDDKPSARYNAFSTRSLRLAAISPAPFGPTGERAGGRLSELDGVRGWAALGVVCYHVFWETLYFRAPEMRNIVTGASVRRRARGVDLLRAVGRSAQRAVLSGQGRRGGQRAGDQALHAAGDSGARRVRARLGARGGGLPVIDQAAAFAGREHWLEGWLEFPITLAGLFKYALFEVFYSRSGRPTNGTRFSGRWAWSSTVR